MCSLMGSREGRLRTNPFRASEATNLHVSVSSICLGSGAAVSSKATISFTLIPAGVHFINSHTAPANNARSQYMSLSKSSRSNPSGVRMDRTSRQTTQRGLIGNVHHCAYQYLWLRDSEAFVRRSFPNEIHSSVSEVV